MPRQYIYNGCFCLDCGKRVQKQSKRCRSCHFNWLRANPYPPTQRQRKINDVRIEGDRAFIILTHRDGSFCAEAIVDTADLSIVLDRRWSLATGNYAVSTTHESKEPIRTLLHRHVLGLRRGDGMVVDHIDRNGLNCCRSNLRVVDAAANAANRAKPKTSRYPGVHFDPVTQRWVAQLWHHGDRYWLGRHDTEEDAFRALCAKRSELDLPPLQDVA